MSSLRDLDGRAVVARQTRVVEDADGVPCGVEVVEHHGVFSVPWEGLRALGAVPDVEGEVSRVEGQ